MPKKFMGPISLEELSSLIKGDIKKNQNGTGDGESIDLSEIIEKIPVPMTAEELREILTDEGGNDDAREISKRKSH